MMNKVQKLSLILLPVFLLMSSAFLPFEAGTPAQPVPTDETPLRPKYFPKGYFVEPTDSALYIAGNFGEIRPNHFHAGLDVKTAGREGLNIYAAAEGWVSRVKISATGYGKALYITHPNGFVTVYGHLQRFYGKIAEYVKAQQYKAETFEMDIIVPKGVLPVRQCDTVAISGNTGGSQAPHLHFEIRDEKTEVAYNPFLFGYRVPDSVPPKLTTLAVYPANDSALVNGKNSSRKTKVYGSKGRYRLSAGEVIRVSGDIGFGLETFDYANIAQAGKLGVYSIELQVDEKRIYYHELNEISFDESRYINSHIDYAEDRRSNREIQKCFRDPNNMLSIYQCMIDEGIYSFKDTLTHRVSFVVKDFFGNTSVLEFKVRSSLPKSIPAPAPDKGLHFRCTEENKFESDGIRVNIPACVLYTDIDFIYSKSKDTLPGKFAPVHTVHVPEDPVHATYSLAIRTRPIPEKYRSKAALVLLDGKNNMSHQKGEYVVESDGSGWMTAQTRFFGRYSVVLDTVAPMVRPYNIFFGKNMSRAKTISLTVGDNLTGVRSWRAYIDGKWVLMEYEPKKALLFYEFDEEEGPEKLSRHLFEVVVVDGKGNERSYKTEFLR